MNVQAKIIVFSALLITLGVLKVLGQTPFAFFTKASDPLSTYPNKTGLVALWRMDQDPISNGLQVDEYRGVHHGTLITNNGATNKAVAGLMNKAVSLDFIHIICSFCLLFF